MTRAILVVDHGSRRAEANAIVHEVAAQLRERVGPDVLVEAAHLEIASPNIADAIAKLADAGATEIVMVPYFLGPGRHANQDVPRAVEQAAAAHGLTARTTPPLGPDAALVDLVARRATDE